MQGKERLSGLIETLNRTGRSKGVALFQIAAFDAAAKPANALLSAAVGEAFRDDVALGALLHRIIADLSSGVQTFFEVSRFENFAIAIGETRPYSGKTIGLQLEPYRERVGVTLADASLPLLDLFHDAEQILHVMPHFVGDDESLRKISRGFEAVEQLAIEGQIDVDFLIHATVKGTGGSRRKTTSGLNLAGEKHEIGLGVLSSGTLEYFAPDSFGAAEHPGHELASFITASRRRLRDRFL